MARRSFLPPLVLGCALLGPAAGADVRPPPLRIAAAFGTDEPLRVRFEARNADANRIRIKAWRFGDGTPRSTTPGAALSA